MSEINIPSTLTIVYLAVIEDHEGCGTIETSVHATKAGAEARFLAMALREFRLNDGQDSNGRLFNDYSADEMSEYLDEEEGKTGGVREEAVHP